MLQKNSSKSETINRLQKKSLNQIKQELVKVGIWNRADSDFLQEFSKKRHGAAHKRPDRVLPGNPAESKLYLIDLNVFVTETDILGYLMRSTRLMLKL